MKHSGSALVFTLFLSAAVVSNAQGFASMPMAVPSSPGLLGLSFSAQGGFVATSGVLELTRALDYVVGE